MMREGCPPLSSSSAATEMDYPVDFRCPISMELMQDPVTLSTGVTYDRKNIEKWLFSYNKKTCPTTMQPISNLDITPNLTLKSLILSWQQTRQAPPSSSSHDSLTHQELVSLLAAIDSTPFKANPLRKLGAVLDLGDGVKGDFVRCGGVEVLVQIVSQILFESSDFMAFTACEEALRLLHHLSSSEDDEETIFRLLTSNPESVKSLAVMLQRGSGEARFHAVAIFQKLVRVDWDWKKFVTQKEGFEFFRSLLELVSDDQFYTKASSIALELLIEILGSSKRSRLKAIEAGAVCILLELLPDSNRSKSEKILLLLKLLCECAEGREAMVEHGLGIAAISKKLLHVSTAATKITVKIIWLICTYHPSERVLEEMVILGSVTKLLALLHVDNRSSTKEKLLKIFKLHGNSWRQYPCLPYELKDHFGLLDRSS